MANRRQGGSGKKPHRKSKKNGEGYSQPELPKGTKKQLNNNNEEEESRQPQRKKQGRPLTVKEQVFEVVKESKKVTGLPSIRAALIHNYKREDGPAFR